MGTMRTLGGRRRPPGLRPGLRALAGDCRRRPAVSVRRVPDGRGVGALGDGHPGSGERLVAEALRVVGGPARRRDLDHAGVVEGALRAGRSPGPSRPRSAPARRWCWSRSRSRRRRCCRPAAACRRRPGLRSPRPGHVVDLFLQLALRVEPALDDLDAVEVGADRVLQRGDQEGRRLARRAPRAGRRPSARPWRSRRRAGHAGRARPPASKSQPPKKRTTMRGPVVA